MQEPLALVGMACRLPGGDGLEEFWQLVSRGGTAWGPLPEDRFCRDLYYADGKGKTGKSYSELGGLVSDRSVDPAVCPLTADMVDRYDIAHQIFLEVASQACRDAGLDPFAMPTDRSTGVYVGHTGGSPVVGDCVYSTRIDEAATLLDEVEAARELLGSETATVAADLTAAVRTRYPGRQPGRPAELSALGAARIVREALRLEGPYLVVDAACASSLQALAIAARALTAGSIDQAIVGGASYCKSDSLVLFSAAQSVSNSGSCPFGRDADGLVTAEGYVALVLKTLSRAVADGDRIRAVIRGIGVASDGKGKSLWAPRQEGQKMAVERAYPQLADVAELDYVEAHATSTQVGDATELGALAGLLGPQLPPGRKIPIGSVKANVGHTLETAGLASLVKVVLAVEHGSIPPGSTAGALNDQFDWQAGPFRVPRVPEPWPRRADGSPRQAAVNAFGIGGLNVHVAIAEYLPQTEVAVRSVVPSAEPIAIVGAGCVLPGAVHLAAFETLLDSGQSAVGPVPADRWDCARVLDPSGPHPWQTTGSLGGFIQGFTYDWRRHKVPPKQIAAANPLQFMLLEAADAALAEAGFTEDTWDRTRMAVVVGTMFGGEFSHDLQIGLRLPETTRILRGLLAKRGLSGPECETVITAYEQQVLTKLPALIDETGSFTSSTLASRLTKSFNLMGGALALDAGDCSSTTAIAAAVDMLREGSSDAVVCAAGQRYMDLVAFEMLSLRGSLAADQRTLLDEQGDGRIPGEGAVVLVLKRLRDAEAAGQPIRGVIRGVAVSAGGRPHQTAKRVIAQAAASALVPPRAVTAAEVSGVCHRQADQSLLAAIGEAIVQDAPIAVGAVDAMIGHTGAAAGAAGLLKLSRSLQSGVLPATTGLDAERIIANTLQASGQQQHLPAATASGYRAGTLTEMHDELVGHLLIDNGLPLPQPAGISGEKGLEMAPRPLAVHPVSADPMKIAALFPGQGSQYTGMLQGIAEQTPEGRAALADLDQLADRCGQPRLAEVAWREPNQLGTGVWETQWAMYLGDLFAWKVLRSLGFRPDIVASHSFGEFPALAAAGGWTEETGATATRGRADAVDRLGPADGAMLSLQADRATVETVLAPLAGRVWRCAENAPEQTVVGGSARCIDALELLMEPSRVRSKRLAVPSPFHTPLLANAAAQLATTLAGLAITSPQLPIISSTTLTRLASPESVRESLIRQMTETVRWVELVEQLYADGVRVFVEVGPSGVLAGLTRRILAAHSDITIVQFDQRGRSPAEQLSRLRETLGLAGSPQRAVVADPLNTERPVIGRIVSFDATSRRRERNRSAALGNTSAAGRQPTPSASHNGNGHAHGRNGSIVQQTRVPVPTRASAVRNGTGGRISAADPFGGSDSYASVVAEGSSADTTPVHQAAESKELESFLVDFVVEQTGYPREIVELDADLEADLGIDSIRKAQLFGEIGQRYSLAADDSLSFDDFPTLRHLLDYMVPRIGGVEAGQPSTVAAALQQDAVSSASVESQRPAAVVGEAPVAIAKPMAAITTPDSSVAAEELSAFLIDFVIEQTGYPREIVELDADLEADLGIDSIRKAQLFGEIGQRYGLAADDSVSLDDFPTLQHLLNYMLPKVAGPAREENRLPPAAAAADPVSPEVYRSANFCLGEEQGRQHAESIRRWARFVPTVASGREPVFPRALGEELDGIAAGAGVSAAAVRAAVADPTAVLGAWETAVSCTAGDSGVAVVCGRQASPVAETSDTEAGRTTLVGLPGLPAAVIGWNTSGLVAWIDGSGRSAAGNLRAATPTAVAVAAVARSARTPAEAAEILRRAAPLDGSVSLLMLPTRGLSTAGADGVLQPSGDPAAVAPPGGLFDAFLAGGEQSPAATTRLLLDSTSGVADRLSAAVHWVAVGLVDGQPVVRGGGPLAAWFEPHSLVLPSAVDEHVTAAAAAEVTRRYLLGCAPLPPAVAAARLVGERVLVLGEGAVAAAIAQAVQASGGEVTVAAVGSQQAAEAAVDAAESIGPVRHLVLAAAADRAADGSSQRINTVVTAAFFACQRWLKARNQAGEIAGATLTAVTRLGGDFGVSGKVGDVAGGGLAGLLKNIAHEFADLQVRVIDHAIEATEAAIGSETVTEICSPAGPVEVGYGASGRQQLLAVEQPLAGHGSGLEAVAAGSVWLVTGGARGVTAACALALGKQYGLRLALVGSTRPVPLESDWLERDEAGLRELKGQLMVEAKARGEDPRQAWRAVEKSLEIARSLAACAAAGVTAKYFACDLADEVAAGRLVAEVERSIGPIRGLLHGAGYEAACRFEKKTPAGLAATVGPKVLGLEHLLAAIDPQQLRAVIGFGSTSGRFGGHGQADYSLANDLLAKIVAKLRHGNGIPATVFHWHAWDEVGMASRPESRFVLEQFGLQFMPLAEGVGHFLREIAGGLPAAEVILTEPAFCEAAGPVRQATAAALPPQATASPLADGSRGSLVATVATEGTVSHVGFQLDPTQDQFLLQHTQYGRPLLPAVMAAELLAQAVRAAGLAETVQELREVQIERPVNFPTDRQRTVEVRVGPENGPSVAAVGWAPVLNAAGQPAGEPRPHISGRVVIGPAEPITRQLDEQPFPFNPMVYQEDAPLHHGRAFRTLSGLFLDRSGGWARLTAPDPNVVAASRGAAGWTVPIALLDGCIVGCAVYSYILLGKRVEVPLRFERLRMVAQPRVAEACTLRLFYRQHDAQETVYDFTLYGDDGQPLLALDGLHLAVVPSREAR